MLQPQAPLLEAPQTGATVKYGENLMLKWKSTMAHNGYFTIEVFRGDGSLCGGAPAKIFDYIPGWSNGETEQELVNLQEDFGTWRHSWRVWPHVDSVNVGTPPNSVSYKPCSGYVWSACSTFTVKKNLPPPATPNVLDFYWTNAGQMLCLFTKVANADHYHIEVQELDPSANNSPIGQVQPFDFPLADIQAYTDQFMQNLGVGYSQPPANWVLVGLDNTLPLHSYSWHVRACNESVCSAWSKWAMWTVGFSWPWPQ
jgi:hypothetical protein